MEIETARLLLRRWRDGDLEPYSRICADPEVMRYIGDGSTLDRGQSGAQIDRFEAMWDRHGYGLWAVEEKTSGRLAGFVGLAYQEEWSEGYGKIEIGWRLGREFWGRGFATEGAAASLRYGFERLGLSRVISIIQPGNVASIRVAEKLGLTQRGETTWRGSEVVWYAVDREEWSR